MDKQDRLSIARGEVPDHLVQNSEVDGLFRFAVGLCGSLLAVERARIRHVAWVFAATDAGLNAEEIATARLLLAAPNEEEREAAEDSLPSEVAEVAELFKNRDLFGIDDLAMKIGYLTKAGLHVGAINAALDAHEAAIDEVYLEAEEDEG